MSLTAAVNAVPVNSPDSINTSHIRCASGDVRRYSSSVSGDLVSGLALVLCSQHQQNARLLQQKLGHARCSHCSPLI